MRWLDNITDSMGMSQQTLGDSKGQGSLTFYAAAAAAKSLQSCPTLCDPIHGSPPGSTVPEILQARTLDWVAIAFSDSELYVIISK